METEKQDTEVYDFTATKEQPTIKYDLSKYILDYSSEIEEPIPIIMQGDKLVISRGNLSVIAGAPKSRKSMFVSAMVASFFGNSTFGLTGCVEGGKCLLFDTESSQSHTLKQIKRIYKLLNWTEPNSNLIVFHLRECSIDERIGIIKQAIEFYRPDWSIIDGLLDLVVSANDDTETNLLILDLMKITSEFDCHITNILHLGKSSGQMLGFLGSYAQRKAETVFQLTKDADDTKVSPAETRNAPFEEFSFLIDADGIPYYNGMVKKQTQSERDKEIQKRLFVRILSPDKQMTNKDLISDYMDLALIKTEKTANTHLKNQFLAGFIHRDDKTKLYRLGTLADEVSHCSNS